MKYTTGGRKVYSGGGIEPDRRFDGPDRGLQPDAVRPHRCSRASCSRSYAEQFTAEGDTRAGAQGKNRRVVRKDFVVDDAMVEDFKQFVVGRKMTIDEAAFAKDKDVHPRDDPLRDRRGRCSRWPSRGST